jgi:hypothetical protein
LNREEAYEAEAILENLVKSNIHKKTKEDLERLLELIVPIAEKERLKEYKENLGIKWSWGSFHPKNKLQDALNTLTSVVNHHQEAKLEEDVYEKETQDLLHALEITDPTDEQLLEYGRDLQILRQKRRNAKDFMEIAAPLFHYSTKNRHVIKELSQVLAEMNRITEGLENRTYKIREKTSLQEAFDRAAGIEKKTSLHEALEKAAIS